MIHLGSITELNGAEIEPVDCITGGSPCQDLSLAGKRAGLAGERSGLFMEQIRIVKEMRNESFKRLYMRGTAFNIRDIRPRFMVWENVFGAFSSNKGEDFQAVLTEIVRIAEPDSPDVPLPEKGKWPHAGELHDEMGRWSVAWRTTDAQYWGTPQRRKRIAVLFDGGGCAASDILFEQYTGDGSGLQIQPVSESMSGDIEQSTEKGQDTAGCFGESPAETGTGRALSFQERAGKPGGGKGILIQEEHTGALSCENRQSVFSLNGKEIAPPLDAHYYLGAGARGGVEREAVLQTSEQQVFGISAYESNAMKSGNPNSGIYQADTARTLDLRGGDPGCNQGGMAVVFENHAQDTRFTELGDTCSTIASNLGTGGNNQPLVVKEPPTVSRNIFVRRLTVTECERLQGYPDGWTDIGEWVDSKGKLHKPADAPRYKALGNSIAIPFWFWLLRRISAQYTRRATLGSLFDGIGGFPLCWELCNGRGAARWASEIEEFAIAVTKKRFPETSGGGYDNDSPTYCIDTHLDSCEGSVAYALRAHDGAEPQTVYRK